MKLPDIPKAEWFIFIVALYPVVISGLYLYGWIFNHTGFFSALAHMPNMVFGTALGVFPCAMGIILYLSGRYTLALSFLAISTFSSLIYMLEYALHMDFHIDRIFMEEYIQTTNDRLYPGRPSLFTTIALISQNLALLLILLEKSDKLSSAIAEMLATFGFTLGFIGLFGYIVGIEKAIGLEGWKGMSFYSSLSLICMGIVLLICIWRTRPESYSSIPPYMGPAMFVVAATANIYTSLGISTGFAYMPFVLSGIGYKSRTVTFLFVGISTVFGITQLYIGHSILTQFWVVVVNRIISIVSLWLLAILIDLIKQRGDQLTEGQHALSAIIDNTVDGLITIDGMGHIEKFNKACETIFGYKPEEVIGKNIKLLMPPKYADEHDQYLKSYRDTGNRKIIGIGREVEGQKKDGTIFPIELSIAEVPLKNGRRVFSGIVRDISARKRAEDEIVRSNMELERFAYIASHDLQEPVRMVSNFTQLLKEEYGDKADPQVQEYMGFITDASRRMQSMITDLLEYSRIGYEDSGFELIDSKSTVRLATENLKEIINETGAVVTIGDLPMIHANPTRFLRLTQNLIGNGIKYRAKTTKPDIRVNAERRHDMWLFSFQDNGIGIRKEYLEQIFIMFKRLHGKNEYQGTGIGLAICKRIVESLHGRIWVESEPGKGSIFYFTIPINKGASHGPDETH